MEDQMIDDVFAKCVWIGADEEYSSPVFVRKFIHSGVRKATLYITGLGYFHATINGKPVTDQFFLPVASDYEPRDLSAFLYPLHDVTTNRIYYHTFDVTPLLESGENLLEIQLGNGWYRQNERLAEGNTSYGDILKATYRLETETDTGRQTIFCDGSETQRESEIRYNNLFHGERIDHTFMPGPEKPVSVLPAPKSVLCSGIGTPDKIIRTITPRLLGIVGSKKVYDVGENVSGVVQIKTSAPKGSTVTLRFAEKINKDLSLDFSSTGADYKSATGKRQIMEDVFVTDGSRRIFRPKFVWHAFRYFEVDGSFDEVAVCVIHSDTLTTAVFSSDMEGLSFLFDAFLRTQHNNMHGSFPSDCPHRERLGYTGDGQVCAPAAMITMDCRAFYQKWIRDILDCQDKISGHVQHTAPFMGGGGGPGGWGSAIITVPYSYYKQYGDTELLEKCYAPMTEWIRYLMRHCENGLVTHEEKGGWCLGDWCTLDATVIPESYVNSCYFVKGLSLLEKIAEVVGKRDDLPFFRELRLDTEEAIRKNYFDPLSGHFANGVQGADAFAVWCGLAGEETVKRLSEKYLEMGHFDTGFLGTDILLEVLFDHGYGNTAVTLLEGDKKGSFLYMKRQGATTLWEDWNGSMSHNHPMFGGCTRHLFSGVLGIRQRQGSSGYSDVLLDPCLLPEGKTVSGSIMTCRGRLSVTLDHTKTPQAVIAKAPADMKISFGEKQLYPMVYIKK